jgi:hypothetical protein
MKWVRSRCLFIHSFIALLVATQPRPIAPLPLHPCRPPNDCAQQSHSTVVQQSRLSRHLSHQTPLIDLTSDLPLISIIHSRNTTRAPPHLSQHRCTSDATDTQTPHTVAAATPRTAPSPTPHTHHPLRRGGNMAASHSKCCRSDGAVMVR